MPAGEIGSLTLTLSVLIAAVHGLGYLFQRLKQPRFVGEILAGALLGPFVLGRVMPAFSARLFGGVGTGQSHIEVILDFIYWIGLFLLMFLSGSESRHLMEKQNRKPTAWFLSLGTMLPFVLILAFGKFLVPLASITGTANHPVSALLILAIAIAVTSIPVISRILFDLKILHTRFASLILGYAVLEDILLWAVLAVATGIASSAGKHNATEITTHVLVASVYMAVGLTIAPKALSWLNDAKWNVLIKASRVGYLFFTLFIYAAIAALLDVNLVFAAFLAGFGVVGGLNGEARARFSKQLESIFLVSRGVFIPIYFAMVGYKLILGRGFSLSMLLVFLAVSSVIAIVSFTTASLAAGFRGLDVINLAITKNARGGPGIVLASVAFDAGIINAPFYTTLVLAAVLTSQFTGAWLRFVLAKGWPLLKANSEETRGISERLGIIPPVRINRESKAERSGQPYPIKI